MGKIVNYNADLSDIFNTDCLILYGQLRLDKCLNSMILGISFRHLSGTMTMRYHVSATAL
jgi:hypothetical protein